MGYILQEYHCDCGNVFEDLVDRKDMEAVCENCGQILNNPIIGGNIAAYSIMSKEHQVAHLKQRSLDHSARGMKKDGEVL